MKKPTWRTLGSMTAREPRRASMKRGSQSLELLVGLILPRVKNKKLEVHERVSVNILGFGMGFHFVIISVLYARFLGVADSDERA